MSQQTWIATALLIGFIVFITLRGELAQYQAILFGPTNPTAAGAAAAGLPALSSIAEGITF